MSITVTPVLRTSKMRSSGKAPVWIRITANRKSRYISTGVRIEPKHWNSKKRVVRKSAELAAAHNSKIRYLRLEAEKATLTASSAQAVKAEVTTDGAGLTRYFETFIETLKARDQYWERKKYRTTLNKLRAALGDSLSWDELTPEGLRKLERYCREERGNNPNTTRKELSRVRRVVNQAIKDSAIAAGDDPFLRYDLPEGVPPERRRLSFPEIRKLEVLDLPTGSDLRRDRDAFILAFYGGGIRFGDVCTLTAENVMDDGRGKRLRYRMMKTKNVVSIQLSQSARAIVEHWTNVHGGPNLFPYLEQGDTQDPVYLRKRIAVWNQMANRSLKEIGKQAGIEDADEVTFHVARHSFADHARKKSKDLYAISKALGHSNLTTTEQYLADFDDEAVDDLTTIMWGND